MASNRTVLDYIAYRRTLENSIARAKYALEQDKKRLQETEQYLKSCQDRLQQHNENPPVLTEAQEARYGNRVRDT